MSMHRQNADLRGLERNASRLTFGNLFIGALCALPIVVLIALAQDADNRDAERYASLARAEKAYLANRESEALAYERGRSDAIRSLRTQPQGVALAQACTAAGLAQGVRP